MVVQKQHRPAISYIASKETHSTSDEEYLAGWDLLLFRVSYFLFAL